MSVTILLVEDNPHHMDINRTVLLGEGYRILEAENLEKARKLLEHERPNLIVLDIMLPELSGMEVLRRLRRTSDIPVIMLTARDEVMDKVSGLDQGADDYITKPFAIEELLARIRAILRKSNTSVDASEDSSISALGINVDMKRHAVSYNGTPIELTKREFDLLHYMLKNIGVVLTRETLLENVWEYDFDGGTNTVDVYIRFLRTKIDETFNIKLIHTVRGVGYVIKDE